MLAGSSPRKFTDKQTSGIRHTLTLFGIISCCVAACAQEYISPALNVAAPPLTLRASAGDPFLGTIESMKHSVAPIVCLAQRGQDMDLVASKGTAVFTSANGEFLTAAHVLSVIDEDRPACPLTALLLPSGPWQSRSSTETLTWFPFETRSCAIDRETDVAKCRIAGEIASAPNETGWIHPVTFEFASPLDGTQVAFTGFPLNSRDPLTSRTAIAGYRSGSDGATPVSELILDHVAWHGGSGSPVYLSDGRVIGLILARGIDQATGIAIARPAEALRKILPVDVSRNETSSGK